MLKLRTFKSGQGPLPDKMWLWPLYGAGFENLGRDGQAIQVPMPDYGPDELLIRHDAVGLCFSDVKVIRAGDHHPRLQGRDMKANPVTLGHEIALTIMGVGENLREKFAVGERYIMQADIYVDGQTYAYGYVLQGGLSQYNVVGEEVLNGDDGCYLLPIHEDLSYAAVALTEPWACVEQAYHIDYRSGWRDGGTVWVIGTEEGTSREYTLGQPWADGESPGRLLLSDVPAPLAAALRKQAASWGIPATEIDLSAEDAFQQANEKAGGEGIDDIVILGMDADIVEQALAVMAKRGTLNLVATASMSRPVAVDVGRIHYDGLALVGTMETDISRAYDPIRTEIKPGGRAWFLGAAGPMGHMLVQYAIETPAKPALVVPHDMVGWRLAELCTKLEPIAEAKGVEFVALNAEGMAFPDVHARLDEIAPQGFDDIVVPAPSPRAVEMTISHIRQDGVINIFAGLPRGTMANLDLSVVYRKNARFTGSSGSGISHMLTMLDKAEKGELEPQQVMAAIASLEGAKDGLESVANARFAGKVVIYPQIKSLPLTPLSELEEHLPKVAALLGKGHTWTKAAEDELLGQLLP